MARSWLQALSEQSQYFLSLWKIYLTSNFITVNIDVDYMNPAFTLSLLPVVPQDMTSNQGYVHEEMCHPDNEKLFRSVVEEYKGQGWQAIYTRMV